ncbi:hypothetical protein AN4021.2 [Aspergillus nidulans FGSC A4]|uniref:C2H2 finger domain protein, putative (AFU_orthologue AFUA_1G03710) n=1 Tax=Emericella nidulans (strain FGSC A4 / ATCC 38163 / CBS 112.46 / NRRL 194 / M139) TaxID=227321 RepID=Q5B609_EMENI|nr:hypothetical protein [Aspergillus nidulans FGSC A4]EAA59492.1 hypothetical protein AN4021.2 [Aspergillus nidulans FGSC A4]CBF74870.1 TPA: C2H2 finger domain protein, putative (AFU_orthologue; AFUA_1G03710) [Aspergillus nidulans FGSC A4]|eukprot:XP_661625.1 hypothetical protein AN4021.2 [Aspergillus nidulans FGSC A4]
MGKKRRSPTLEEVLARPWCYYCERDFDDLKILISHQKAKHFKCERCGRRLNTAGGLSVHMSQVHKEQLTAVDNALSNRSSLDVEIFGMEGVPEDAIQSHNQRVIAQFQQSEAERQAITGNPPSGASSSSGQPAKKPKVENISDLKKRLAEHKAKKAEARAGGSSGEATPVGAGQTPNVPGFAQQPTTVAPTQTFSYPQPYGGAGSPYQATASPVYPNYSPGQPQFPTPTQYSTPAGYSPQPVPVFGNTPPQLQQQPPPAVNSPQTTFAPRSGSLPTAPSLPQRPAVGAPQVNAYQLQQMHMGHPLPGTAVPGPANGEKPEATAISSSIDDLISGAAKQADQAAAATAKPAESAEEKPSKKDKSKQSRLVYSDNETSPEEKMARLPRYAFNPDHRTETTLQELPASVVVGQVPMSEATVMPTP